MSNVSTTSIPSLVSSTAPAIAPLITMIYNDPGALAGPPGPLAAPNVESSTAVQAGTIMAAITAILVGIALTVIFLLYRRNHKAVSIRRRQFSEAIALANARELESRTNSPHSPPTAVGSVPASAADTTNGMSNYNTVTIPSGVPTVGGGGGGGTSRGIAVQQQQQQPQGHQQQQQYGNTAAARGRSSTFANPLTHGSAPQVATSSSAAGSAAAWHQARAAQNGPIPSEDLGPGHLPASVYHQWGGFGTAMSSDPPPLGSAFYDPMYDDEL